jgi:uncharacterized Zn finger protein
VNVGARLAAHRVTLECPRCSHAGEHELTELERDGSLRCVGCGGRFAVDPDRLGRMAKALRSVDALLGSWRSRPEE